jgi:RNA polymerase sigma factor (sigma-70 family)
MANSALAVLMDRVRQTVFARDAALSDEQLLSAFIQRREEAAFEAIVRRHGAMVLSTCRRVLRSHHDAEDAFQATFLVLAHKAATITSKHSLANWLYGVAYKTSLKAKSTATQQRRREQEGADMSKPESAAPQFGSDVHALLDEELSRLPDVYRSVIVICDLEGKTRKQAARQLGCPEGTVAGRLARARALLAKRLTQRGVALSAAFLAGHGSISLAAVGVPAALIASTSKAAMLYAARQAIAGAVAPHVAALAAGVLRAMTLTKIMILGIAVAVLVATSFGGVAWLTVKAPAAQVEAKKDALADTNADQLSLRNSPPKDEDSPRKDLAGDPLPAGAFTRLGTDRLRHGHNIGQLTYSPDGRTLFASDQDGVHVWDAATGRRLRRIGDLKDDDRFQETAVSADHRIVATSLSRGEMQIWDTTTGRKLRDVRPGNFPSLFLSPDGKTLIVLERGEKGPKQGLLRLIEVATGSERIHDLGPLDPVQVHGLSHDGKTLATTSDDAVVRFWDVDSGKRVRQLDAPGPVGGLVLSPDNRLAATVGVAISIINNEQNPGLSISIRGNTGPIILWDLKTGKELSRLKAPNDNRHLLVFSPDSKSFLTSDGTAVRWWDVASGKEAVEKNLDIGHVNRAVFSPDGKTLAVANHALIQLWDFEAGQLKTAPLGHHGPVWRVAASPDGRTLATVSEDLREGRLNCSIRLWDALSGKAIRDIVCPDGQIWNFQFDPSGQRLVSTFTGNQVHIWDVATGKMLQRFSGTTVAISPDGRFLATHSSHDFLQQIWDLTSGQELGKWKVEEMIGLGLSFAPDGRSINYTADKRICVAFSPDGRWIATGGSGPIAIHDIATGRNVALLQPVPELTASMSFSSITFSPDSRLCAASTKHDGTVRIWEIATRRQFRYFAGHTGEVFDLAFSAAGSLLLSGSKDATGLVWDVTGQHTLRNVAPFSDEQLKSSWADLGSQDPIVAQRAIGRLAARPKQALGLIQNHLRPIPTVDAEKMRRLLARLGDERFQERMAAERDLMESRDAVEAGLRQELEKSPPLESRRRIEVLLKNIEDAPERLQQRRILQLLEQCGTPETNATLRSVAGGATDAWLTKEATAGVERLARRSAKMP